MKITSYFRLLILLIVTACSNHVENLDYPQSIDEIERVFLSKPDIASNGEFAEQKILNAEEVKELLAAIDDSKVVGPMKFRPDYFIVFETKGGTNKKLRVNGDKIKGDENDFTYEIALPKSLGKF